MGKNNFDSSAEGKLSLILSKDQQLNALKKMRDLQTDREAKLEIQVFIEKRIAEIVRAYKES